MGVSISRTRLWQHEERVVSVVHHLHTQYQRLHCSPSCVPTTERINLLHIVLSSSYDRIYPSTITYDHRTITPTLSSHRLCIFVCQFTASRPQLHPRFPPFAWMELGPRCSELADEYAQTMRRKGRGDGAMVIRDSGAVNAVV